MLRIFTSATTTAPSDTHVFQFTSSTAAREEANEIKDALSSAIQAAKAASAYELSATARSGGKDYASAALATANAVSTSSGDADGSNSWYDDRQLKSDVDLQKSLLKADSQLQKTFMESLRTKPESISIAQFTAQFWSTRAHLLRAHAIEKNQSRGAYNVLSSIKPKTEDNITRLSISKEQIQLIFNQYPLVKRVYDENVPNINETVFWSKFFLSRLFKKLKGEEIVESDPVDPVIDKYLRCDEDLDRNKRIQNAHIPHIIDIEGNEENHSQRKGNQPDVTMRPASVDKVPIIRTLNNLSERIMASVAPVDGDPSLPIGMNEETFKELELQDLQADSEENRIILNIKDQQRFFAKGKEKDGLANAAPFAAQDQEMALRRVQLDLQQATLERGQSGIDLESAIAADEDSDDEVEETGQNSALVGSKSSLMRASRQILEAIAARRSQTDDFSVMSQGFSATPTSTLGLSPSLFDRVSLTHATTTEFLHHFWTVFLSGDPDRANEVGRLAESLDRAMDRISAVAHDAEDERAAEVEEKKKEIRDIYQATGKKMKLKSDAIGGGSQVVNELLGPTIRAVGFAVSEYKKALSAEAMEV